MLTATLKLTHFKEGRLNCCLISQLVFNILNALKFYFICTCLWKPQCLNVLLCFRKSTAMLPLLAVNTSNTIRGTWNRFGFIHSMCRQF